MSEENKSVEEKLDDALIKIDLLSKQLEELTIKQKEYAEYILNGVYFPYQKIEAIGIWQG
jgi:hypothetical protein